MLSLKPGVRLTGIRPELVIAVLAAERVYAAAGHNLTITACTDGKHSIGSFHYSGAAVDLRTRDLPAGDVSKIAAQIRDCLGADFDVVIENDHLHVEHQPKQPVA